MQKKVRPLSGGSKKSKTGLSLPEAKGKNPIMKRLLEHEKKPGIRKVERKEGGLPSPERREESKSVKKPTRRKRPAIRKQKEPQFLNRRSYKKQWPRRLSQSELLPQSQQKKKKRRRKMKSPLTPRAVKKALVEAGYSPDDPLMIDLAKQIEAPAEPLFKKGKKTAKEKHFMQSTHSKVKKSR